MLYGPLDLRIEEREVPKIDSNEVLVKTRISTTCGTDVKNYQRGYPLLKPPHMFGHEFSGDIVALGENVLDFNVGDRIVAHNSAPCNHCYFCKKGQQSMCKNLLFNRGSYAEYVKVPFQIVKQNMFHLEEHMSYKLGSLLEPFSCAVYGISQLTIDLGDYILINGCGPIGLMFAVLAKLRGATVVATDISSYRLAMANKLGCDYTIDMSNEIAAMKDIRQITASHYGADYVIEATGLIPVWEKSTKMVRKGGTVLLFGGTKIGSIFQVDANLLHYSQLTLKCVFHTTPRYVHEAFDLLKMHVIDENIFIQNEYDIEHLEEAIIEHGNHEVIKNCIVY